MGTGRCKCCNKDVPRGWVWCDTCKIISCRLPGRGHKRPELRKPKVTD